MPDVWVGQAAMLLPPMSSVPMILQWHSQGHHSSFSSALSEAGRDRVYLSETDLQREPKSVPALPHVVRLLQVLEVPMLPSLWCFCSVIFHCELFSLPRRCYYFQGPEA